MKLIKRFPQVVLGLALGYAGIGHLTTSRQEFQAQVPNLLKDYADFVVAASGVVEIALGVGLVVLWRYREAIGCHQRSSSWRSSGEISRSLLMAQMHLD